jgi:acyl-CoA synthetase (AMP-forming)/AMP-acid ligase II
MLLSASDFEYVLNDSRCCAVVLSASLLTTFEPLFAKSPFLRHVIVSGSEDTRHMTMTQVLAQPNASSTPAPTTCDDMCFWLYMPGYEVRIVDDAGHDVPLGESGELYVRGPTSALLYWNNRARSSSTFLGDWTRTGDKFRQREDGRYVYEGRCDDMLKVSGLYVSPAEVEAALMAHEAVLEAAVVAKEDGEGLVKPCAFVVLKAGYTIEASELQKHVKSLLAPYKYPRWIEFMTALPKTATGKIQRFKLRQLAGGH